MQRREKFNLEYEPKNNKTQREAHKNIKHSKAAQKERFKMYTNIDPNEQY